MEGARDAHAGSGADLILDRADLARELRFLKHRSGFSNRALARAIGIPFTTVSGWLDGSHLPQPAQRDAFIATLRCVGVDAEDVDGWVSALARARGTPKSMSRGSTAPWRGLHSYEPGDAELFFGRETLVERLVRAVADALDGSGIRLLAVVGPSGSGKSSLLRAGLVAAVRSGAIARTDRCELMVPGDDPAGRLTAAVQPPGPAVVVVDQFEEIFTVCSAPSRQRFLAALTGLATQDGIVVVFALRADFYADAASEPSLAGVLQGGQLLVTPMSDDELRRAIVRPAERAGLMVDRDLVEVLVRDVQPSGTQLAHDAGALPLLSHALLATWEQARSRTLRTDDYLAAGGIDGAIQRTAEEVYDGLTEEEQDYIRRLFLRLVHVSGDEATTRRRIGLSELPAVGGADGVATDVVDQLIERRLVTAHEHTLEISHEALLTAWSRLAGWVRDNRAEIAVHEQISDAARAWLAAGADPEGLLRGRRLEAATEFAASRPLDLSTDERQFVDASLARERNEYLATRRQLRQLRIALVSAALLAIVAVVLATVAFSAQRAAKDERDLARSRQLASDAVRLRDTDPSLAAQLAVVAYRVAPTFEARSALLDATAVPAPYRMLGARGATEALSPDRHVLALSRADGGDITLFHLDGDNRPTRLGIAPAGATALGQLVLAFSPDGEVLAAGNDTGTVVLYDVSDPRHAAVIGTPLRAGSTAVGAIAFSHDGTVLAAAGDDATVHRWAVGDHGVAAELAPVPGPDDVLALAFTPAGTSLVVAGRQGAVAVWNVAGERPVRTATLAAGVTTADAAAYSPDGSVLAVGSRDKTVRLWRISDRHYTPLPSLAPFTSMVNALDFSADGSALAAGSSDRSIVVFETATWTAQRTLPGPAPVTGVRFLADDRSIASVADDGSLRLWTLPGHALVGARDNIFNLSYTADGRTLIVGPAGEDNTVEQWDVADEMHPRPAGPNIESDGDTFSGAAVVSPDGTLVASGTVDGTVQLYDRTDPARPVPVGGALRNGKLLVESTAFSPDGRLLVVCTDDGGVRLWNVRDPSAPTLLATITERDKAFSASFSPDGKLLAVADGADVAFLYDIGTPDDPHELATLRGFTDTVYSTAFTRDGTTLVVGSADRSVRVWDVSDPEQPRPVGGRLTGPGGGIYFLALGAEDTRLAAASLDGTVWVWDFTDRAHPVRFASLSVTDVSQFVVAFSPDGRILSGAGQDRVVHDWMTDPGQAMAQVCATTGDSITRAEWRTYLPDQAYDPPCP